MQGVVSAHNLTSSIVPSVTSSNVVCSVLFCGWKKVHYFNESGLTRKVNSKLFLHEQIIQYKSSVESRFNLVEMSNMSHCAVKEKFSDCCHNLLNKATRSSGSYSKLSWGAHAWRQFISIKVKHVIASFKFGKFVNFQVRLWSHSQHWLHFHTILSMNELYSLRLGLRVWFEHK